MDFTLAYSGSTFLVDYHAATMGDAHMTWTDIIVVGFIVTAIVVLGRAAMRHVIGWATADLWRGDGPEFVGSTGTFDPIADVPVRRLHRAVAPTRSVLFYKRLVPKPSSPVSQLSLTPLQSAKIDLAVLAVRRIGEHCPGNMLSRHSIQEAIKGIPGFSSTPPDGFFGTASFAGLLSEIARRDAEILFELDGGGSVRFVPKPLPTRA
jgi:hypothetical protein